MSSVVITQDSIVAYHLESMKGTILFPTIAQEWIDQIYLPFMKSLYDDSYAFFIRIPKVNYFFCNQLCYELWVITKQNDIIFDENDFCVRGQNWPEISRNSSISISFIIKHLEYPWDWSGVSANPNLTLSIVQKYPDKNWRFTTLSSNPGIRVQDIINHPAYPWNWEQVSANPNLTMSIIIQYPSDSWVWHAISRNPGIMMQDIINHPEYPWNWYAVSANPNLNMHIINNTPKQRWDWDNISQNPGITIQDIINHPEYPWRCHVKRNLFTFDKSLYVNNQLGRILLISMLNVQSSSDLSSYSSNSNNNHYLNESEAEAAGAVLVHDMHNVEEFNSVWAVLCSDYHIYRIVDYI